MMKAIFIRKAGNIDNLEHNRRQSILDKEGKNVVVEKEIILSNEEFAEFEEDLFEDRQFIEYNKELMFIDKNGVWHCIMVKSNNMACNYGILVEAEGYNYPRYAAFYQE